MTTNILAAFNDHFEEFLNDIYRVFPEDNDILTAKNSLSLIRKANPKLLIKIWNTFIVGKYRSEIEAGNLTFFMEKDYSNDVSSINNSNQIMDAIDRLRAPVKLMSKENQEKTMKYIQNLSKLSAIYER